MAGGQDTPEPNSEGTGSAQPPADTESNLVAPPSALSATMRGQRVGPYQLISRLGGGAMATVYRAIDTRKQRQIALKVLLPDADAVMRERFRREAETHSLLIHPNIVQILDVGQDNLGLTYIAMELVDGPNLSEVMEETLRLSPVDAAKILEPIARALDYANSRNVIHRDVKPSNVLLRKARPGDADRAVQIEPLDEPVVPLLSDFGIARALDAPELTSVGRTIGTPTYMSPEQCADSHEIDGRSDIYSLGAVFYRCVVGRPPYSGTTTQILHAHVYDPLTIPEDVLLDLPPSAVTILRRTLAKDPAQRYATGAELAADLAALRDWRPGVALAGAYGLSENEEGVDPTATMPAVAAVRPPGRQSVLIPGPDTANTTTTQTQTSRAGEFAAVNPYGQRVTTPSTPPPSAPPPRRRWVGAVIGGALATLVLLLAGGLVLNLLPKDLLGRTAAAPTPAAVAQAKTPGGATAAPGAASGVQTVAQGATTPAPVATVATNTAGAGALTPGGSSAATPSGTESPGTSAPASTPGATPGGTTAEAPVPTPSGSIASYWEDAHGAYAENDWQATLDYVNLVQRINKNYERDAVEQMLFDSRTGLAARELTAGNLDKAAEQLDAAAALRPNAAPVLAINRALQALVSPGTLNKVMARWSLATELLAYGESLLTAGHACAAAEQLRAANSVLPNADAAVIYTKSQTECAKARSEAAMREQLALLRGRILYSTQIGEAYQIFRAPAQIDALSTLLIDNGSQPARQHRTSLIAFHSTNPTMPGIALSSGLANAQVAGRLTTAPEDAMDAPPSWSGTDTQLAFGSTSVGDRRSDIYIVDTASPGTTQQLGLGRDPAWHPTQDVIAYNGFNDAGGEPGLWEMKSDGSDRSRLTDNGNDIRPTWSPDGKYLVFMSTRDGNWEVYRLEVATGALVRLTNDQSQDGLPSVSPDGKWVAFASDRGGYWRIWVTPIDGGEPMPLVTVSGVLTNWLEHAIQWIP